MITTTTRKMAIIIINGDTTGISMTADSITGNSIIGNHTTGISMTADSITGNSTTSRL
jgi:hypothetical protein